MHHLRVLIADDHPTVTERLVSLLRGRFEVVSTVADGNLLLDEATRLQPDIIITDIAMPGLNGLEVLERLKASASQAKVVVLTMDADPAIAAEAIRSGASAFVLKILAGKDLLTAIDEVLQGRLYVTPSIAKDDSQRMSDSG